MSRSRKHVTAGALQDCPVPEGEQEIARVSEMRGGNIVEVVRPDGEKLLCLMPAKFKKTLWIKRGISAHCSTAFILGLNFLFSTSDL